MDCNHRGSIDNDVGVVGVGVLGCYFSVLVLSVVSCVMLWCWHCMSVL